MGRQEELEWFQAAAQKWPWKWARTYAKSAPHSYVDGHKNKIITWEEFERSFMVLWALGRPRKFYRRVNIELEVPDLTLQFGPASAPTIQTGFKFWTMANKLTGNGTLNMAPLGHLYGDQDVPTTASQSESPFDMLAGLWQDLLNEKQPLEGLKAAIWRAALGDRHAPSILDLYPHGGLALDIPLGNERTFYRAVDPSQGLMNQLIYRHQWVRDLHVMTPEEYLQTPLGKEPFSLTTALMGGASYLEPSTITELAKVSDRMVLMFYRDDAVDFYGPVEVPTTNTQARRAARALPGAQVSNVGRFEMVVA